MKKVFALLLSLAMIVSLAACGGSTSTPATEAPKAEAAAPATEAPKAEEAPAVEYPTGTIKLVVPFSAGGGTDLVGRAVADGLAASLGQSVTVENVTGGSGMVGTASVINAKADGYTLLFGTVEVASLPAIGQAPEGVDSTKLQPIYLVNSDPACITVPASSEYQTIEDLIEAAKAEPETLTIGNGGAGGSFHLAAVSMEQAAGCVFQHIPSADGTNAAVISCLGGFVDAVVSSAAEVSAQVEAGEMRILAVAADERLESYPDVPTLKESGINVSLGTWRGLFAPAGVSAEVVEVLDAACAELVASDAFTSFMNTGNYTIMIKDSAAFTDMINEQVALYTEVGKALSLG